MKRSTNRILTTHTGSLPRPPELAALLRAADAGEPVDRNEFEHQVRAAVAETVRKQVETGIDVVNDGEMGKPGYATYIKDRVSGFGGQSQPMAVRAGAQEFPEWTRRQETGALAIKRPSCDGPIAWKDFAAVQQD